MVSGIRPATSACHANYLKRKFVCGIELVLKVAPERAFARLNCVLHGRLSIAAFLPSICSTDSDALRKPLVSGAASWYTFIKIGIVARITIKRCIDPEMAVKKGLDSPAI